MERVSTYFTNNGAPALGLSPIINIWQQNGDKMVTNGALTELAGGFYVYNFDLYDMNKIYLYQIDGGSSLTANERYKFGNNEMDSYSFKYSYGRTAIPTQNYQPHLDEIKGKFDTIKGYDDTEVKKILGKLEKSINIKPKKEKNEVIPVLTELQNQINDIKNLIGGIDTESGTLSLGESINEVKDNFTKEIKSIESNIAGMLQKMNEELSMEVKSQYKPDEFIKPVKDLDDKVETMFKSFLAKDIPSHILSLYDMKITRKNEDPDTEALRQLEEMFLNDND